MESNFDSRSESRLSLIQSSNTPHPDLSCWRGSHTAGLGTPTPSNGFNFIEGNEITDLTYLNQLWIVLNDQVKQLDQENIILKDKLGTIASIVSPYFDTQHYLLSFRPLQESHQLVSCDPMVSKLTEIGNSLNSERDSLFNKANASVHGDKSNPSKFDLLKLTKENKQSYEQILAEEADQIEEIALYFHLNPHLSRGYKLDFMRTLKKFKEFSPSLSPGEAKLFLEHLIKNSNLNFSTVEKHVSHLRIYLKEWLVVSDRELEGVITYAKSHWMKPKRSFATTEIVSETYLTLRDLDMKEEALFLFLTYSLCLSPRCLWFLTAGSIAHNNILTYWDPAMEQYKEIILSCQAKKLIESYESELKYQDLGRDWDKRVSNDGKTVIFGMFLFSKKPTCWNNLFRNGFKGSVESFNFTPTEVMNLTAGGMKIRNGKKVAAYLPLRIG